NRGITGRDQRRFSVEPEIGSGNGVAMFVVLQGPGVVTITMQDRLILHPVVSHARYFSLSIVSGPKDRYTTSEHRGLSIKTHVDRRGGVTLAVVFGFHAVIAVLVQDWFALRAVVGCPNGSSQCVLLVL